MRGFPCVCIRPYCHTHLGRKFKLAKSLIWITRTYAFGGFAMAKSEHFTFELAMDGMLRFRFISGNP